MERLISVLIGYAFGLIQTGYFVGKMNKIDIREHGSGNAGTTNTLRTLGWKAGVITLLGDCFKCVVAILLVRDIYAGDAQNLYGIYAGLGVVLGHNYPFYLHFKGGKGIASTAGLIIATNWVMVIVGMIIFGGTVAITKYVSLGSIFVMISYFVEVLIIGEMGILGLEGALLYEYYGIALVLTILAIARHHQNIIRLFKGTENKISFKK